MGHDWLAPNEEEASTVSSPTSTEEGRSIPPQMLYLSTGRKMQIFGGRPKKHKEILERGQEVQKRPHLICEVLTRVFGESSSQPQLQQKFFGNKQSEGEDIVSVSPKLVNLFDWIILLNTSLNQPEKVN